MQRIAVLTRQPDNYSSRRFLEAGAALRGDSAGGPGVQLELVDPHELYLGLLGGTASVARLVPERDEAGRWDCVIPRIGGTATEYALFALQHLEQAGVRSIAPCAAVARLRHKFSALSELAAAGLPVPDTMMLRAPGDIGAAVERLGGYPVVLKFIRGSQGVGVVYADNLSVAQSVLEALNQIAYDVMVQRFYPAAAAGDVRVLVLGGAARWAVRRASGGGEFRANFHRGGRVSGAELTEDAAQLAQQAAAEFGLGFAGVDLVADGAGGWLVLEVNGSPGFEAAEQVHGKVVAEAVLGYAAGLAGA